MNPKHLPLLNWLAYNVLGQILDKNEFEVFTPDVSETGNIMLYFIRFCDRARWENSYDPKEIIQELRPFFTGGKS